MNYFQDYKEIDERNKRSKEIQRTRQSLQKERKDGGASDENGADLKTLME